MPDTPDQVGSHEVANEYRDSRFTELDAQIAAENRARQQETTSLKSKRRRRAGPRLPAVVRKEIAQCAQQLRRYRELFIADSKLKDRVTRVFRSLLPPKRKRGRPGIGTVTIAIRLLKKYKRQCPTEQAASIWRLVYPQAIPDYCEMTDVEQKDARRRLRQRVKWRQHRHNRRIAGRYQLRTE